MAIFIARLKAPDKMDKHYLHTIAGGVNECVHIKNGSVLPNCVGYAWGRWYELLGKEPKLSTANAEVWWCEEDGYERGQTPKLGAVICWSKGVVGVGKDGAGHVAIVEQINADGSIVTSNSAWNERGGTWWYKKTLKPPYIMKGYDFQGFIYLPMAFEQVPEVTYRVYADGRWLKEVTGDSDYAGIFGKEITDIQVRLSDGRSVSLLRHTCSGWEGDAMDCVAMKAEGRKLKYRVHILGGKWLPWVSGFDTADFDQGFAGVYGKCIDGVQIKVLE